MINGTLTAVDAHENGHWMRNAGVFHAGGQAGEKWTISWTVPFSYSISWLRPIGSCLNTVDTIIKLCYNEL